MKTAFDQLISTFSSSGKEFEVLCKWILETDPVYASKLVDVWMWADWPNRWADQDLGIDLIARDTEGKIWAIQAKNYNPDYYVTKEDIDSFISESDNDQIDCRLLIATTENIGPNAKKVIDRSASVRSFSCLMLDELKRLPIVWPKSINDLSGGGIAKKYTPKPHQQKAISDVIEGFKTHDRGQMIMACGTGKTLAGLWIAEALEAQNTLVLFPSLLLLSSTLKDWLTHSEEQFSFLPVCSDGTVIKKADDSINLKTSDLSFPSTTNEAEIAEFLKRDGKKVIFSTYQSCRQIAAAFRIADLKPLDLVIADEAHRCAGKAGADYTTALDDKEIPASKRLFMTATPKIYKTHIKKAAAESGVEVLSMDDEDLFGPVIHKLSFGEAIDQKLLSDYQVVVVGVDDALCAEMISERQLIQTENEIETDAQSFANHIGLAKAIKSYDLRRVITFHSKVKSASAFQQDFAEVVDWMPEASRPSGSFITNYVSGEMSTSVRNQNLRRLGELENGERAILSNARCLSEGVDVPALDGVAFIDPRNSEIDIVQAVGRAIRLSSSKTVGTIVIPVFIAEHEDPDEVLYDSVFKKIWAVVNALRSHDEGLGIEFDILRQQLGKRGSVGKASKIHFDLPTTISVEFEEALSVKLIESTTASWEFWFGLLEAYKEEYDDCLVELRSKYKGYLLGYWVSRQRKDYKKGELALQRVQRLDELEFVWDKYAAQWEEGFAYLKTYKDENENCSPSQKYETSNGFKLGTWVSNQRAVKEKLTPEKIQRLDQLGFIWDEKIQRWEEGFAYLKAYIEENRNCLPSQNYKTSDGYKLGAWVADQRTNSRKKSLSPERMARLNAVGFIWNQLSANWEEGFAHLKAYEEEHKNCIISSRFKTSNGFALGNWVGHQKREKITSEQVRRLDDLGFIWDRLDLQWEEAFSYLKTYKEEHGSCSILQGYRNSYGFALGAWVSNQRTRNEKGKLSKERIEKLNSLNFIWDMNLYRWDLAYSYLSDYKAQYGHSSPEARYKSANGFTLGKWVRFQRKNRDILSIDQIKRLDELSFEW